jgi:hypothetical protein
MVLLLHSNLNEKFEVCVTVSLSYKRIAAYYYLRSSDLKFVSKMY